MRDADLIGLLKARDQQGMDDLLRRYGPLMRYIIAPILPDPRELEECISDVALLVWERVALYDPARGSWVAWLSTLTRNTALNRARAGRRFEGEQELPASQPSSEAGPEEETLRRERLEALGRALSAFTVADQALFYRKYYYLQSTAQIASELSMTERAVEGRLYRLKKRLRKALGGDDYE